MNILQSIRRYMTDNRIRRQYERVEKAIRDKASLASNLEFHRTMSNFYTERVLDIDPHTDWWDFANAKQKQYDHQEDFGIYEKRILEADAKVAANKTAFAVMKQALNETSSIK